MRMSREFYDEIVAHALAKPHTEVCGLVAAKGDEAVAVYRCVNTDEEVGWGGASFTLDPVQQILLLETMERDGHTLGAIYHSHPGMSGTPSMIDEDYAANWPGVVWIIVGMRSLGKGKGRNQREPEVWAWRMENGQIYTAELIVDGSATPPAGQTMKGEDDEEGNWGVRDALVSHLRFKRSRRVTDSHQPS